MKPCMTLKRFYIGVKLILTPTVSAAKLATVCKPIELKDKINETHFMELLIFRRILKTDLISTTVLDSLSLPLRT